MITERQSLKKGIEQANVRKLNPHSKVRNFMENVYEILCTDSTLEKLTKTIEYLERKFSEINNLLK